MWHGYLVLRKHLTNFCSKVQLYDILKLGSKIITYMHIQQRHSRIEHFDETKIPKHALTTLQTMRSRGMSLKIMTGTICVQSNIVIGDTIDTYQKVKEHKICIGQISLCMY